MNKESNNETNQPGSDKPQASENKSEGEQTKPAASSTEPAPESASVKKEESSTAEAAKATETKPDAASGAESAPATGDNSDAKTATESKTTAAAATTGGAKGEPRVHLNGGARKRYRWLLARGIDKEKAAKLAKEPLKIKELGLSVEGEDGKKLNKPKKKAKAFNFDAEYKLLGAAAKKRLNWLLINGHTEEEAMTVLRKTTASAGSLKRARSDGLNGSLAGGPLSKLAKPSPPSGPIRMAVAPKNYPVSSLTNEQSNTVKSAILKQVVQQKDSDLKPRFENCAFVGGYLLVNCSDQPTLKWLQQVVPKLELWADASVKVVSEKNLLKADIFIGHFGDSGQDKNEEIMSFVESQNDGISTAKWAIITRKELSNKKTIELSFTVDPASAKLLQKLNFELNYKFAKVTLRKKVKPAEANKPSVKVNVKSNVRSSNNSVPSRNLVVPRRPTVSNVPIWDSNLPMQNNYSQVAPNAPRRVNYDQQRSNRSGELFDRNRYGGNSARNGNNQYNNVPRNRGNDGNSYGSGGGGNQANSNRNGNNQYNNGPRNRGNNGNSYGSNDGGNQSESRSLSLVESLYEQLNRSVMAANISTDQYASKRGGGGGSGGGGGGAGNRGNNRNVGNNQNGANNRNRGNNSASGRGPYGLGNRNFFTNSKLGFF